MSDKKPYSNIPGTVVFDSDMARTGYHLNQFCMSLMKPENRARFLSDQRAYLDEWPMSDAQAAAVLERDYNALLSLGGNVYYLMKIFFTDKKSVQYGSSQMAGMTEEDYRTMMINGGRPIEGNRYLDEDDDG